MSTIARLSAALCLVVLSAASLGLAAEVGPAPKTVPLPSGFSTVSFSQDGRRVAFGVAAGEGSRVVVDGKPDQAYDAATIVEFSPRGDHYFYGGKRDGRWFLIRDGQEITELGSLTSLSKGTGLHVLGESLTVTIRSVLPIWFAEQADNYFVLAYHGDIGKVFKDGAWLPLEYSSFQHQGMALSPDGQHYAIAVTPVGEQQVHMYLDGKSVAQFSSVSDATFLQPGNQLIYSGTADGVSRLMLQDKTYPGVGPLVGEVVTSSDQKHCAALVKPGADQPAVVVDGKQESSYQGVDWRFSGFFSHPGSFVWSKDGTSHAYVVTTTPDFVISQDVVHDGAVVHNGNLLARYPEVRGSSLVLDSDGKHVAYAAKNKEGWAVVLDTAVQGSYEDIGVILFAGNTGKLAYTAKTSQGWKVYGAGDSPEFDAIAGLTSDESGAHLAYAAKTPDAKWQVFVDAKPVGAPCDGVALLGGLHVSASGAAKFVAITGNQLVWIEAKPQ